MKRTATFIPKNRKDRKPPTKCAFILELKDVPIKDARKTAHEEIEEFFDRYFEKKEEKITINNHY